MPIRKTALALRLIFPIVVALLIYGVGPAQDVSQSTQNRGPALMKLLARMAIPGTNELQLIVELTEPSVVEAMQAAPRQGAMLLGAGGAGGRGRINLDSPQTLTYRAQLARSQSIMMDRVRALSGAQVQGSTDLVMNSIIVRVPIQQYRAIRQLPGVKKVYFSRPQRMNLDGAAALQNASALWTQAGGQSKAGQGVKIGLLDSGIDISHPMFADTTTTLPAGYPKSGPNDAAYTNHKVIVARNYINLLSNFQRIRDARDEVGHGTFVGACAAGKPVNAPLAQISGMAPGAFLGSYKVFGTPGINDGATTAAILAAINDAVADGMDVLNLSLGSLDYIPPSEDPEVIAISNAIASGLVVALAAGNEGPDTRSIGTPGSAPDAISVGAIWNSRVFAAQLHVTGPGTVPANLQNLAYELGTGPEISTPIPSTPILDVASLDGTGLACSALPASSLDGKIAFIARGTCTFVTKVTNAADAGARAVVIFDNVPGGTPPIMAGLSSSATPSVMMYNADGLMLKSFLAGIPGVTVSIDVSSNNQLPTPITPVLVSSSSRGPAPDFGIKPDIVAVGWNVYSAAQKSDPAGDIYDATGFTVADGTSFSTPMVSGAAAAVKQLFPSLTSAGIKSLLVNTAGPITIDGTTPATIVQAGNGLLDMGKAAAASAVFSPTNLNFGVQEYSVGISLTRSLQITNISGGSDQYALSFQPVISGPKLSFSTTDTGPVQRGASTSVDVTLQATAPLTGGFQGFVLVQSSRTSATYRIPYWAGIYFPDPSRMLTVSQSSTATNVYRNLSEALAAANPGNIIEIADSQTYTVPSPANGASAGITIGTNAQGLPLHGIAIRAAAGQTPVLDGTATSALANLLVVGVRNVLIQGLTITGGETGIDILQPSPSVPVSVTIDHCSFMNQSASSVSSAIFVENGGDVDITDSTITGSSSSGIGILGGARVTMSGSTVQENQNDGIDAYDSNIDLINSTITGNVGVGAYLVNCTGTLTRSTFARNTGFFGDGIEIGDGKMTVAGNTFDANDSAGVYLFSETTFGPGPTIFLERNIIQSNGIYGVQSDRALDLRMTANTLKDNGTGFIARGVTNAVLINNIIVRSRNTARGHGADVGGSGSVVLVNNTISQNQISGIATSSGAGISVINSIISQNRGGDLKGLTAGQIQYSLIGDGTLTTGNNRSGDPKFTDPGTNDFSLASGSPAIDAGSNEAANLPFLDYNQQLRVASAGALPGNGVVDMGALEAGSSYALNYPLLVSGLNPDMGDSFITGIAVLNPSTSSATQAIFTGYDPGGALLLGQNNPNSVAFQAESQVPIFDWQLLGFLQGIPKLGAVLAASVQKLMGFFLIFDPLLSRVADGVDVSADTWTDFYLVRHLSDASGQATYQLFNPGVNPAKITATLFSSDGSQLDAPKTSTLPPKGQYMFNFNTVASSSGYVHVQSDRPITGLETWGNSAEIAALRATPAGTEARLFFPHIAVNQGYSSLIGVVNTSSSQVNLTLTAFANDGSVLGTPTQRVVNARGQLFESASSLFGLGSGDLITGYVSVSSDRPGIAGFCAFTYDNGIVHSSAAVPSESIPQPKLLFSHIAHQVPAGAGGKYLTGIALLNPYGTSITYTMRVFDGSGTLVAEMTDVLRPRAKVGRLLSYPVPGGGFFTQPITLANGHVEVTTDYELLGFELFFTESLSQLAAVMAQFPS